MIHYKGCIYPDYSSKGKGRGSGNTGCRYVRGVGRVNYRRWVAQVQYHGKRYRCRSTNRHIVEMWLTDMCNKFNSQDYELQHKVNP